jgi:hypothetical protein
VRFRAPSGEATTGLKNINLVLNTNDMHVPESVMNSKGKVDYVLATGTTRNLRERLEISAEIIKSFGRTYMTSYNGK